MNLGVLLPILEAALRAPLGLVVATSSPSGFTTAVYSARKSHAPLFDDLTVRPAPDDPQRKVWIVKKSADPKPVGRPIKVEDLELKL